MDLIEELRRNRKMMIRHPITTLHDQKASTYFELVREDVAALVPTGMLRILDIGCGKGKRRSLYAECKK